MYSQPLAEAIAEAESLVAAAPLIGSEADLLEGLQYLAGCIAACTHVAFDYDRDHPFLHSGTGPFTKMGLDNPDTMYFGTRVQPGHEYVVTGKRGTTTDVSFQLLGGEYTDDNVPDSETAFDDRKLDIAADGTFEWRFTPARRRSWSFARSTTIGPHSAATFAIARTDTVGTAPPPLTSELIEKRYAVAGKQLVQRVKTWLQFPQWFYGDSPANTMVAPRLTPGGLATQYSSVGQFDLTPDQALIITLPVTDAPYLGFQLGSLWYISLDYINHQTSLNGTQAQADPDGKIRIVVSDQNPGVTNWVETLGHRKGFLQFRWQRVSRELTEADGPTVELWTSIRWRRRCRTTRRTRSPMMTGGRGSRSGRNKSAKGWWARHGWTAGQQGRRHQRRRTRAGHHSRAAMCRARRRPGAGGAHRRTPRRRRQADHRPGPAGGVGRHRHHRRGPGAQPRRASRSRPTARSTC